ncbi:MAG: type II/IV secretion system protein, partial [Planctomycetota bacterium]
ETAANPNILSALDPQGTTPGGTKFVHGKGCRKCLGTGFSGRLPIFEIMPINPEIRMAIEAGVPHSQLHKLALEAGMKQLSEAGLEQAIAGRTSLEEVYFKTAGDRRSGESERTQGGRRESDLVATSP